MVLVPSRQSALALTDGCLVASSLSIILPHGEDTWRFVSRGPRGTTSDDQRTVAELSSPLYMQKKREIRSQLIISEI
ncbi:hypothetical protein V6N13_037757 [Hibiscus sabdariffa]